MSKDDISDATITHIIRVKSIDFDALYGVVTDQRLHIRKSLRYHFERWKTSTADNSRESMITAE